MKHNGSKQHIRSEMEDWEWDVLIRWQLPLFLASAVSTHSLQQAILSTSHRPTLLTYTDIQSRDSLEFTIQRAFPEPALQHIQKALDALIMSNLSELVYTSAASEIDLARLKAASSPHSEDWLHAPPIASIGLLFSDRDIRLSVAQRFGVNACSPCACVCSKPVDAKGLNGLSCRRYMARHQRHSMANDIIWRAVKQAKIHAHKEPTGLVLKNGKAPDGVTLIHGPGAKRWRGTSLSLTHMQRRTYSQHPSRHAEQPSMQ